MTGFQIREPEVAIAVGRCVTARSLGFPKTAVADHLTDCGWCVYPVEVLSAALREWTTWAEFNDRSNTTGRHALRTFVELPRDRQRELVLAAQAFPEPMDGTPPPVAFRATEPPPLADPDWLVAPIAEEAAP